MRVLVNSFPKSGTNLLEKLIRMLGFEQAQRTIAMSSVLGRHQFIKKVFRAVPLFDYTIPIGIEVPVGVRVGWLTRYIGNVPDGSYFTGHAAWGDCLEYILARHGVKVIHIVRDPRSILSSMASYVIEEPNAWYPFHRAFKEMSRKELLRLLITGGYVERCGMYYSGIAETIKRIEGWMYSQVALVVRFEDLVGSKGGGSDERQFDTIERIVEFIGIGPVDIKAIQENLFGGTHTFRGGQVDRWKLDFDDELGSLIRAELGGSLVMQKLGYGEFL
jgi:hypothetical protein